MAVHTDIFTGAALCSSPTCQWETSGGWSGIEAKYTDEDGNPACWSHRDETRDEEE